MKFVITSLLVLVSVLPAWSQVSRQQQGEFGSAAGIQVLSSSEQGVVIRITSLLPHITQGVVTTNLPGHTLSDSGSLPTLRFEIAVPHDAESFTATLTPEAAGSTFPVALDAGVGAARIEGVTTGAPVLRRGFRVLPIYWAPFRIEGSGLGYSSNVKITVAWKGNRRGAAVAAGKYNEGSRIESILASSILNFSSARAWYRETPRSAAGIQSASGWGMGEAMVLTVPQNGIYRISAAELEAAGAAGIVGVPVDRLGLSLRKQSVPFFLIDNGSPGIFDRDDAIEFLGSRFKGKDGLYYSEVTDTNAYILRWDGSVTSARVLQTVPAGEPTVVSSYDSTLHFEADDVYYGGATRPPPSLGGSGDVLGLHVSERVPMERFYWQISDSRAEPRYYFECSPEYVPGGTTTLRIMFAGVTNTHRRIIVSLNEHGEVGVVEFTGQKDSLFTFTFPTTLLVNGRNFLKLFSNEPGDTAKLTYLDYFSLTGRWQTTVTSSAEPRLTLPSTLTGQARIELLGLRDPVSSVISNRSRGMVESNDRGYLVKLTSRNDVPRILPGFVAEGPSFTVATPAFAGGIVLIEINRATGDTVKWMLARTHASAEQDRIAAFTAATNFLSSAGSGNVIAGGFSIGFGDESGATVQANSFKNAMIALGSESISRSDLGVSAWTFVVEKGNPASMQERFGSRLENMGGIVQTGFLSAANGSSYRASIVVDGTPGEQIQFGTTRAPGLRYHGEDVLTRPSNSAEMVIIAHPKFAAEAERLATYRTTQNNLPTSVVDVFTIYDEFNDGIKSPEAIRDFLMFADSNWASPKPGFVLLFGDGTWDPMKRNVSSIMDDYVPTFGIPASDYLYTVPKRDSIFFGNEDLEWRQMIGRLPAITTGDARAMVDKLIEYDTLSPAAWNKRFVFLAGGDEADPDEIPRNISHYQRLSEYVVSPLFGGDTALVARTSPDAQQPSSGDAARARAEINRGAMWVSFSGHGSTNVVDLDFGYPEDLDIGNRYMVLATFSCRTGDFAVPGVKPRNESFMTAPRAGAVATIGSAGYSYSDINKKIEVQMFYAMTSRYQRNLGAIFTKSVKDVFDVGFSGTGFYTPEGTRYRNHLTSYTLLGDPSMDLVLSDTVELALSAERTAFLSESGRELNPSDSVAIVNAQLWNHGRPVLEDSVMVVATIISPTREETSDTVVVAGVSRYRDLTFRLPLMQQPGEYTIRIEADPQGRFGETERRDNLLVLTLPVRGNQHLPLEPLPFGRVAGYDNVAIHLLNPSTGPGADIIVDTTADFSSPSPISSRTTGSIDRAELTTTWTFSIPSQWRSARTFWYRAIATTGDPDAAARFPLIESFTVDNAPAAEFLLAGEKQMKTVDLVNLVNDASGVGPGSRVVTLEVRSIGQTRFESGAEIPSRRVEFRADGRNIVSGNRPGINLVVLPSDDVIPITTGSFAFYNPLDWPRFVDYVRDSIQVGDRVLMAANGVSFDYPDSVENAELRAAVLGALESIGVANPESIYSDDSYAMIGGKGLPPSMVRFTRLIARDLKAAGQEPPYDAVVIDSFSAVARQGYLATPTIGPATAWRSLTLGPAENGLVPDLTIFGLRRDGLRDSLMRSDGAGRIDLASIDPLVYPRLDLRADFQSDTTLRLRSIHVDFDPSPELALLPSSIRLEKDSVLQGDKGALRYTVVNLSRRFAAHNITVRLSDIKVDDLVTIDSTILSLIPASGAVDTVFEIATDRMVGHNRLALNANPTDNPSEPYRQNNSLGGGVLRVGIDKEAPSVAVYADGNRLMYGDFVAPGATFEIRIFDNSRLKIDSSSIQKLIFDNEVIVAGSDGLLKFSGGGESGPRGTFSYKPPQELESGEHGIIVHSVDASGNIDISEVISFTVERDLRLAQVVNVPNPFAERTVFTFMVAGTSQPTGGEIGIFTLAGRKVRTIPLSPVDLRIGFNRIEWNGLDEDGDRMANGVYFYRLRVDEGDRRQEILEKLVIMR